MKNILFILTLIILPLAQADLGYFEKGTCVDVKTVLNASTVTLSTLSYPNTTTAITNAAMTKQGNTFNYTFCNTDTVGKYIYDYYDQSGNSYVNTFEITYNGEKLDPADAMVYIALIVAIGFFFVFLLYLIPRLPKNDNYNDIGDLVSINRLKHLRPALMFLAWVLVTLIAFMLSNVAFAYLPDTLVATFFFTVYRVMMVLVFPLMIFWSVKIFLDLITDLKNNKILGAGGVIHGDKTL